MNHCQLQMIAQLVGVPITELNAERVAEIMASPQAQLKTARFKKGVYFVGGLVFKGPYKSYEAALMNNLQFNHAIELLETALQLHELYRGSLRWKFLGCAGDDQFYLAAINVGRPDNIPFEIATSKIESDVKVVPRKVVVKRVFDIEGTSRLTEDVKLAALQHLYLRFLLDIGDSGTHNILVREDSSFNGRLIAGIDLEEMRFAKVKERQLDHLFKKPPSKQQIHLYKSVVCKIKPLKDCQLDREISDRLVVIGINLARLKNNMELWGKLS
jgi:hypothetical protein